MASKMSSRNYTLQTSPAGVDNWVSPVEHIGSNSLSVHDPALCEIMECMAEISHMCKNL